MSTMEKPSSHQSHVLFDFSPLDGREEVDDKLQRAYLNLKQLITNKTPKECQEAYMKLIATNPQQNTDELTMGLLVAILIEQDGTKYYRDIVAISKDSFGLFGTYLNMIIIERMSKLRDHSLRQIFWIFNQLMKAGIALAEAVCSNLIRQTVGGNLSARNLWLCENILDILIENRNWVINSTTFMIPTCVYTFMRLVLDHMGPAHSALRQKEVDFVIGLIREKFLDSIQIGRDLLRLLHNVIKIPEFEKLWHDIFNNPKSLHPSFDGPLQLLNAKTPRRLFQSRLTFEMEKKINFLATSVRFGNQKRYQDWLYKQYLSTPESLSLRCDLIRYICTIIHPSNEVLCSDIIPRWAILGWLLTTCTSPTTCNSAKLTLFFDWLSHDPKTDNIMNIEPAILVMYQSIRSHPTVTMMLLDYLCRLPTVWLPKYSEQIKSGVRKCLQHVLEKKVVPAFVPLYDFANPPLKALLRESYPEFFGIPNHIDNGISNPITPVPIAPISIANQRNHANAIPTNHAVVSATATKQIEVITIDHDRVVAPTDNPVAVETATGNKSNQDKTADQSSIKNESILESSSSVPSDEIKAFSWNGTENSNATYSHKQNHDLKMRKIREHGPCTTNDQAIKKVRGSAIDNVSNDTFYHKQEITGLQLNNECTASLDQTHNTTLKVIYPFFTTEDIDFKKSLTAFDDGPLKGILEDLSAERCYETRCSLMDKLISTILDNSEHSNKALGVSLKTLGHCLAHLLADDFTTRIFPRSQDNKSLEESIATPFFVLCRSVFSDSKAGWTSRTMSLLVSIAKHLEGAGFLILYFLRVSHLVNGTSVSSGYKDFCTSAKRNLFRCLYDDLSMAVTYDTNMFCFLIPSVFSELATSGSFSVTGNIELIHLVVSAIDPSSLQELICLCLTGTAKIIDKTESIMHLIVTSLTWETWEQYCLWKIISAQGVPVENYMNIIPRLNPKDHPEVMSSILLNLQKVAEPTTDMLQLIIDCDTKANDLYTTSILRYWSIKTDVKELAKMISSLSDSRPPSPQVKRKGQTKATNDTPLTLSEQSEKILNHLESIRHKAPKNKLLVQPAILDMLSQLEPLCNDSQKKKFSVLFSNRPKPAKKLKKTTKEVTSP